MKMKMKTYVAISWTTQMLFSFGLALGISSGGMFFVENFSIVFLEEEPSPETMLSATLARALLLTVFVLWAKSLHDKFKRREKELSKKNL